MARKLQVEIVGDASSIIKASKSGSTAVTRGARDIEKAHLRIGSSFGNLAKRAAGAAVGFAAAYASIEGAKGAIDATDKLAHTTLSLSKNFGLTVRSASEWAAVAQARGIDGNRLTLGFKSLATQLRNAELGSKSNITAFKSLGISQDELRKHGNDLQFMLAAISDGLAKLPPGTNRAAIQAKLFGRTWQTLSPLLRDGSKNLNDQLGLADKYGATFSDKGAKGVEDLIKAQIKARLATLGLQVAFGTTLAPILTKIIGGFANFVAQVRDGTGAGGKLRDTVIDIVNTLAPLWDWMKKNTVALAAAAGTVGGLVLAIKAATIATEAWTAITDANPWVLLAQALIVVTGALVGLEVKTHFAEKAWASLQTTVQGILGWIGNAATTAFNIVKTAAQIGLLGPIGLVITHFNTLKATVVTVFGALETIITGTLNVIKGVVNVFVGVFTGDFGRAWTGVKQVFSGGAAVIVGIVKGIEAPIRTAVGIIGDVISGGFKTAVAAAKTVLGDFKDALPATWKLIEGGISTFATGVKNAITGVFAGAVNIVIQWINDIIGVIDVLPGVDIHKIAKINTNLAQAAGAGPPGFATGGLVNRPTFMVGEESPRYPEYVISTNPRDRSRMIPLVADAARSVGVPGFSLGGIVSGIGSTIGSGLGALGHLVSGGAGWLLGQLPGVGGLPDWLQGMGKSILGDIGDWIKNKVKGILGGLLGGGGSGGGASGGAVYAALSALGWNRIAAAGAIGNAAEESSMRPTAFEVPGDWSHGVGLWQWTPGTKLSSWAAARGLPWASVVTQAAKLTADIGPSGVAAMNSQSSPGNAATWLMTNFERPGIPNLGYRISQADAAYAAGYARGGIPGFRVPYGGGRAGGGYVRAGTAYTVGENGPETFVPGRSGMIRARGGVYIDKAIIGSPRAGHALADRLAFRLSIA